MAPLGGLQAALEWSCNLPAGCSIPRNARDLNQLRGDNQAAARQSAKSSTRIPLWELLELRSGLRTAARRGALSPDVPDPSVPPGARREARRAEVDHEALRAACGRRGDGARSERVPAALEPRRHRGRRLGAPRRCGALGARRRPSLDPRPARREPGRWPAPLPRHPAGDGRGARRRALAAIARRPQAEARAAAGGRAAGGARRRPKQCTFPRPVALRGPPSEDERMAKAIWEGKECDVRVDSDLESNWAISILSGEFDPVSIIQRAAAPIVIKVRAKSRWLALDQGLRSLEAIGRITDYTLEPRPAEEEIGRAS